jgi:quinol monooxygenase YgiN
MAYETTRRSDETMIIIAGTISIPADRRDGCLAASAPFQLATRTDEPGCSGYVFSADPCADDQIVVYECWDDAASLEAHFLHPNFAKTRAMFAEHGISGATVRKYRVDASGPVHGAGGVATAEFD